MQPTFYQADVMAWAKQYEGEPDKVIRICPVCQVEYTANPTRLKWGRETTCSRKCSYQFRSMKLQNRVDVVCPVCHKSFSATPSRANGAKYTPVCSTACLYRGRSLGIIKREVSRPYNKRRVLRYEKILRPSRVKWVTWICETCGAKVMKPSGKVGIAHKRRFCSPECASVGVRGKNNPAWRGGYKRYYGPNWNAQRRLARQRDGHRCCECGITRDEYGSELPVHHIKRFGDCKDWREANDLNNLITLCNKCHMKWEWADYPNLRGKKHVSLS